MKNFVLLFLFAGFASAQTVTVNGTGTVVTATDKNHDTTCVFVAPNQPTTGDFAVISCYDGGITPADLKTEMSVRLNVGDQIGDDFVADGHTISWTLERKPSNVNVIMYSISVDGHVFTGTF